jgi:hypothetical protein
MSESRCAPYRYDSLNTKWCSPRSHKKRTRTDCNKCQAIPDNRVLSAGSTSEEMSLQEDRLQCGYARSTCGDCEGETGISVTDNSCSGPAAEATDRFVCRNIPVTTELQHGRRNCDVRAHSGTRLGLHDTRHHCCPKLFFFVWHDRACCFMTDTRACVDT